MNFSKLTLENISQIGNLLMSIWPQHYPEGCPVFSEDYLHWIFGGPNKDKHILLGAMMNDELVAYQSFLYRRIYYCGDYLNAYLCTHAAISPQLDLRLRMKCFFQLAKQYALFIEESKFYKSNYDLFYAFYDIAKPTKESLDKFSKKYFNIEMKTYSVFNSYIVIPNRLRMYIKENKGKPESFQIRPASENDLGQITIVFNRIQDKIHFSMIMTEDELKHHFFGHPAHRTFVIEDQGAIRAFINFYPLEFVKRDKTYTYIIIEFLISEHDNKTYASALLKEAVTFAEETGAKGVVFENATYLDQDTYQKIGLIPTFRKMAMTIFSKKNFEHCNGGFRSDVK